ncbi:YdcF family protein [Burkholderia sp. Ac-20353]|uniref:YdcF family protein n=1 Tax=Burkholderia sp. Ac-20353 TaxID=2703894 RepID=UPI00197B5618|nr:YdcF family protein [Burkholderia sp. Ac-20353]MBN3789371.1 YdcF family protein [Burkholderia sp. Ac-20353]
MILFYSFALLFIAFVFLRKLRRTIAIVTFAVFWLLATGWLAAPLIAWTQAGVTPVEHPAMRGHTALILLGAGTKHIDGRLVPPADGYARIRKVAELYRACRRQADRCTVIVSGGDPQRHGATEAATYAPYLVAGGVAPEDLTLEANSRTTYENAKFTAPILRSRHDDERILVTSSYQMRRALLDFRRFDIEPQPVFANRRDATTGWLPRWQNLANAEQAAHELVGIAQFHVYRWLGWF